MANGSWQHQKAFTRLTWWLGAGSPALRHGGMAVTPTAEGPPHVQAGTRVARCPPPITNRSPSPAHAPFPGFKDLLESFCLSLGRNSRMRRERARCSLSMRILSRGNVAPKGEAGTLGVEGVETSSMVCDLLWRAQGL